MKMWRVAGSGWRVIRPSPLATHHSLLVIFRTGPYDLTGKAVSCFVYLPSELAPSGNPQAYIQLFVKDKDFRNQFNPALDIVPANVNQWLQLNLTVGQGGGMDNGFDSQQINALGISIKLHHQATLNYAGSLYIDHCAIQQP